MTRRRMAAICAGTLGATVGIAQQPKNDEISTSGPNAKRIALHQEVEIAATAERIFDALLDGKEFGAITGMAAEIDPKPGGAFKTFGGLIEGRNVELIPAKRIVQAWRPTGWESGIYSIVHFELRPHDSGTLIVLDHVGFPEGMYNHLSSDTGWSMRYWNPLKKWAAGK